MAPTNPLASSDLAEIRTPDLPVEGLFPTQLAWTLSEVLILKLARDHSVDWVMDP